MTWTLFPENATAGSPSYTAQILRQDESVWHTPHPSGLSRPLGAFSGRRPFAWNVALSGLNIQIAPGSGVLDVETPVATGAYRVASDATDNSLNVTAAHATLERIDGVYIQVDDNDVDGSTFKIALPVYVAGTPASSGSQTPPTGSAIPARSLRIATIAVPHSGSGSPSVSMDNSAITVAAGGVLPLLGSGYYPSASYPGQTIDDASLKMQLRSDGSSFTPSSARSFQQGPAGGNLTATLGAVAGVTVPAGNWVLTVSGYFDVASATARTYAAQIWNSTTSAVVNSTKTGTGTLISAMAFSMTEAVTVSSSTTFQARVSCSVVDGTQLYQNVIIIATNAGPLN